VVGLLTDHGVTTVTNGHISLIMNPPHLGNLSATHKQVRKEGQCKKFCHPPLVTSGVFWVSRHPRYLGFVLPLSGIAIGLGTATPFTAVLAFFVITSRWHIPFEENKMEETFGSEYLAYKTRTDRWAQKRPPVAPDAIPSHYAHTAPGRTL